MAYFKSNEHVEEQPYPETADQEEYDDGFDDPEENEEITELTSEEKAERTESRLKLAFGAGNLFGVITGTVLILILVTMIFSMIHFAVTDISRSFSLFQTNF